MWRVVPRRTLNTSCFNGSAALRKNINNMGVLMESTSAKGEVEKPPTSTSGGISQVTGLSEDEMHAGVRMHGWGREIFATLMPPAFSSLQPAARAEELAGDLAAAGRKSRIGSLSHDACVHLLPNNDLYRACPRIVFLCGFTTALKFYAQERMLALFFIFGYPKKTFPHTNHFSSGNKSFRIWTHMLTSAYNTLPIFFA